MSFATQVTLVSIGGTPTTPTTAVRTTAPTDLVTFAVFDTLALSPPNLRVTYVNGPTAIVRPVVWALSEVEGVWLADLPLQLGGAFAPSSATIGGLSSVPRACTYSPLPALVPWQLTSGGGFARAPAPLSPIVHARLKLALGFAATTAAGAYAFTVGTT